MVDKHEDWFMLVWNGTNNKVDLWSYRSFDNRFTNKIALAFMTYIIDLDAYELHLEDE
jgi:hypothetical protein